jgi:pimeloyl-ACP methyl ester carboxylesterase
VVVLTSTERLVETNGVQLRVTEAGYRVLAPDQRGYGGSSKPGAVDAYNIVELSADIAGLLDDVGAEPAVIVGHDFGGVVAWGAPLLRPDRFAGVVGLSVPPVPRPKVPTTQAFCKVFGDNFFYILYFQEQGPAGAELNRDPATTLRELMGSLTTTDEAAALRMLQPGPEGFIDRNWEPTATTPAPSISVPSLFIGGTADPTLAYTPRHRVREVVSGDYREVMIDGAGHWLQQERAAEVNEILLYFLSRLELR